MDKPILIAIDHADALEALCRYLEELHFKIVKAATYEEALAIVQGVSLRGMVVVSNWIVSNERTTTELAHLAIGTIPSVMLVRKRSDYAWFDVIRDQLANMVDYCSIPFDVEEVRLFMKRVGLT
jgi:DNA-binding NtrC family response regulator